MIPLSTGAGRCIPTHQLSIRPVSAVIELGALADVIHTALNAAHHTNRQGAPDDRIAVALPGLHVRRGAQPGQEVVLFGSAAALSGFVGLDGVQTLFRRRMVKPLVVTEAYPVSGEFGTAFVRDRQVARRSPGAMRRARERAARRGIQMPSDIETRRPDPALLALHFGSAVVHVRALTAVLSDQPLLVSTYGFSSPETPAVLPILPDRMTSSFFDAA